jgi:CBS domain-containing protein
VRTLFAQGAKIRFLMDLISALNTRLLARVAELLPGMPAGSTLLVLGSEGRHEQILKTDQDNALILPEDCADPTEFALQFSQQLEAMGFPPCPGGVMVRNPVWRCSESAWIQTVRGWIQTPDDEAVMHLAMLLDASAVSGPEAPVTAIRESIFALASNPGAMQRFAAPAIRFRTPLTLFGGLRGGAAGLDIKKGGVFPLVHGVRALALQHRVTATNTFARIAALSDIGAIHATNARDIAQALSALLRLRLAAQIAAMSRGETPNNVIQPNQLRRLDVELLRDALRVVREFQDWLRREFHLD